MCFIHVIYSRFFFASIQNKNTSLSCVFCYKTQVFVSFSGKLPIMHIKINMRNLGTVSQLSSVKVDWLPASLKKRQVTSKIKSPLVANLYWLINSGMWETPKTNQWVQNEQILIFVFKIAVATYWWMIIFKSNLYTI